MRGKKGQKRRKILFIYLLLVNPKRAHPTKKTPTPTTNTNTTALGTQETLCFLLLSFFPLLQETGKIDSRLGFFPHLFFSLSRSQSSSGWASFPIPRPSDIVVCLSVCPSVRLSVPLLVDVVDCCVLLPGREVFLPELPNEEEDEEEAKAHKKAADASWIIITTTPNAVLASLSVCLSVRLYVRICTDLITPSI